MKIAVVIPDRADRPLFLEHCIAQMKRQTVGADFIIIMGAPAVDGKIDLTKRYREGFTKALIEHGCDLAIAIENDDWYSPEYIQFMVEQFEKHGRPDVIGINSTIYYNIISNQYVILNHPARSSMMSMAVGRKILDINWCADDYAYLDWHIWNFCPNIRKVSVKTAMPLCVGIKHGQGLCGGGGHTLNWKNYNRTDKDWVFLRGIVGDDSEFYKSIKENK
jgi:hypothetical protein